MQNVFQRLNRLLEAICINTDICKSETRSWFLLANTFPVLIAGVAVDSLGMLGIYPPRTVNIQILFTPSFIRECKVCDERPFKWGGSIHHPLLRLKMIAFSTCFCDVLRGTYRKPLCGVHCNLKSSWLGNQASLETTLVLRTNLGIFHRLWANHTFQTPSFFISWKLLFQRAANDDIALAWYSDISYTHWGMTLNWRREQHHHFESNDIASDSILTNSSSCQTGRQEGAFTAIFAP